MCQMCIRWCRHCFFVCLFVCFSMLKAVAELRDSMNEGIFMYLQYMREHTLID